MVCVIMIVGSGCAPQDQPIRSEAQDLGSRFQKTGQKFNIGGATSYVIEDTKTKVLYLQVRVSGSEYGLCPWYDENGEPMKAESGGGH